MIQLGSKLFSIWTFLIKLWKSVTFACTAWGNFCPILVCLQRENPCHFSRRLNQLSDALNSWAVFGYCSLKSCKSNSIILDLIMDRVTPNPLFCKSTIHSFKAFSTSGYDGLLLELTVLLLILAFFNSSSLFLHRIICAWLTHQTFVLSLYFLHILCIQLLQVW